MKNPIKQLMGLGVVLFSTSVMQAQYPDIPPTLQEKTDAVLDQEEARLAKIWTDNAHIIKEETLKGRPYLPWASYPKDFVQASIPAFPGAEGGGEFTPGGRGGKIFVVTSLEDSGPGTFREACEAVGARIIVFNVSGIIKLKKRISMRAPYVTIAGQTAPGDGICIAGETLEVDTHDVIIRHMRFRRGATDVTRRDDALGGNVIGNVIIDHCSASWGLDENISLYRHQFQANEKSKLEKLPTCNITIQNTISSEGLDTYNHAFGSTIGGLNSTFMRNLWADNISRNCSIGMYGDFNFVNNVVFNWWNRSLDGGDYRSMFNIINNYFKPGPITPKGEPISYRILKPESGRSKLPYVVFGRAHVEGNIIEGNEKVTKDNWNGGVQVENKKGELMSFAESSKYFAAMRSKKPFPMPKITIIPTLDAKNYVLTNAGASLPRRDPVDTRIIKQVVTGKIEVHPDAKPSAFQFEHRRLPADSYKQGIITEISQVGGYPEYKGTPYKDSDNDGMPDAYEIKNGLNPKDASDAAKITKSGYANIEVYLNSVVPVSIVKPIGK